MAMGQIPRSTECIFSLKVSFHQYSIVCPLSSNV